MKRDLAEIAEVRLGYQFRGRIKAVSSSPYRLVQIKDFDANLNLVREGLTHFEPEQDPEPNILKSGDVLFLSRGHRNWSVAVEINSDKVVAVAYFFVLRVVGSAIRPSYLAWYLNQAPAQGYLRSFARRGSHMPMVPKSALVGLPIDIPSLKTQEMIVELDKLAKRERQLQEAIASKRGELITLITMESIKHS